MSQSGNAEIKVDEEYHPAHIGAMVGERCEIGHGVVTAPGVIIGNRCRVGALKVLDRSVPDAGLGV